MIDDVKQKLETLNARNGYAVFPRQVVVIEEAGEVHQQSERTVAILKDETGVGVLVAAKPGPTRDALIHSMTELLTSDYEIQSNSHGLTVKPKAADD